MSIQKKANLFTQLDSKKVFENKIRVLFEILLFFE